MSTLTIPSTSSFYAGGKLSFTGTMWEACSAFSGGDRVDCLLQHGAKWEVTPPGFRWQDGGSIDDWGHGGGPVVIDPYVPPAELGAISQPGDLPMPPLSLLPKPGDIKDDGSLPEEGSMSIGGALKLAGALSLIWSFLPEDWQKMMLVTLAGMGVAKGSMVSKAAFVGALGRRGAVAALVAYVGAILADSFLVDIDIPFTPSVDLPDIIQIGGGGGRPPSGFQHGAVVKTWQANGRTFYKFEDGYQAVQKNDGSWKVWKPKKPVVYVPGGAMSRRTARKMAQIYANERKKAKKDFDLVERAPRQRTRRLPTIRESGSGSVIVN